MISACCGNRGIRATQRIFCSRYEAIALDVAGHIRRQGFEELAIGVADAERAGRLPGPHRDPFHRMFAAQALARELPFISADPAFDGFNVIRVW